MTKNEREYLLRVMPQENINEYMERYGFTLDEVYAEMERRRKVDEEFLATELAKVKVEFAEKEDQLDPEVVAHTKTCIANLDSQYAKGLLSVLDYLDESYWSYCPALENA